MNTKAFKYITFMLASCCAHSFAGDVPVEVFPMGFQLNYVPFQDGNGFQIPQGVEFGLLFRMKGEGELYHVSYKEGMGFSNVSKSGDTLRNFMFLTDMDGNRLGVCKQYRSGFYEGASQGSQGCYFSFDDFPPPGKTQFKLTGQVTACLHVNKTESDPVTVTVKKGESAQSGNFAVSITEVEHRAKDKYNRHIEFLMEPQEDKKIVVIGLKITDMDGNPLECSSFSSGSTSSGEELIQATRKYSFVDLPEKLKISVIYWRRKDVDIPVDVIFDLNPDK